MKLFVNDKMYVQLEDLVLIGNLPNFVIEEMSIDNTSNGFEEFKTEESIEYFKSRDEIIDYSEVKNCNEKQLYDHVYSEYDTYFKIDKYKYKNHREEKRMEVCEYKIRVLKDYIDYKKVYDEQFETVINGGLEWLKKKKSLKKN